MRSRKVFWTLWLTLILQPEAGVKADAVPAKGLVDGRIRTAVYGADEVFRLRGRVGYQIDVQFETGETLVGLGAGDMEGLAFVAQDNHLFLKPKAAQVATNLTILTNRRQYQFDYSTASTGEIMYALRFSYLPVVTVVTADSGALLGSQLATGAASRPRNSDYWYCGAPLLMPVSAWDDGVQTRLRFATRAEQPAIFALNDDESESLLNFSMEGEEVVVHRLAHRLVLRRGKLKGCVLNRGFAGAGERLPSGTVAAGVERASTGGVP